MVPVVPSPPSLPWRSCGRASAVVRRRGSGLTGRGGLPGTAGLTTRPRGVWPLGGVGFGTPGERCCRRYQLPACLDPGLGERSRRGLQVKLLFRAASGSGKHQPCSRASLSAPLGRGVLQPSSFWSVIEASIVCAVSRAYEREAEVESISPDCEIGCLHFCKFIGGGCTLPCLSLNFESFNRLPARQLSFTCQIFADLYMYICIYIQFQAKVVFSLSSFRWSTEPVFN